jgi:hypothetical protein
VSETIEQAWSKRARRLALIIILIVAGLGVTLFAIANQPPKILPKIGATVADGNLSFTVKDVVCDIGSVETVSFTAEAKEQFCQVSVIVKNTGNEEELFWADDQVFFDTDGNEYLSEAGAMIDESDSSPTWMKRIKSGQIFETYLLFDVPLKAIPSKISLQSEFSAGVEVSLKQ